MVAGFNSKFNGIDEIFLIGPVGTSKTFVMAYFQINVALQFPDSIIPVGRKDMAEATTTTWPVYMEVLDLMGLDFGKDYTVREAPNDLRIKFANTSIIQFIGMNKSRDRQFSKLKVTATTAGVDEVDDVDEGGYNMLTSRTGRRNRNGAPRVMMSCCNPNDSWTKRVIYLPWLKRINRRPANMDDNEWNSIEPLPDNKMVIEFEMTDSRLYHTGYYDRYGSYPKAWRQRYLLNNWNYIDDEDSLFKGRQMDKLTISTLSGKGEKFMGVDPNAGGKDRAALVLWEGDTITHAEVYTTEELDKLAQPDEVGNYGAIIGRLTIEMAEREGVAAHDIAGDVVGIGQGWLTYMMSNGYKGVVQYRSGDAPEPSPQEKAKGIKAPYFDLRSQMFALWAFDVNNGRVFFYSGMPHLSALKKELQLHSGLASDKVMRVTPKNDIKALLGASPDIADAAVMAYRVRVLRQRTGNAAAQRGSVGKSMDELYNSSQF